MTAINRRNALTNERLRVSGSEGRTGMIFKIQLAFAAFYNITGLLKNCGRDANHETCFLVRVGQTNRGTVSTSPQQ